MRSGIILAAGESSRMPNKPLLPIAGNKICIESSYLFLVENGCDDINVVVSSYGVIPSVLTFRGLPVNCVIQPTPCGVCDAIARGACAAYHEECIVCFGDNIYDLREKVADCPPGNHCTVRDADLPQLDGYDPHANRWADRNECKTVQKLAGWIKADRRILQRGSNESLVQFLNDYGFKSWHVPNEYEWWDLGTLVAYELYVKSLLEQA